MTVILTIIMTNSYTDNQESIKAPRSMHTMNITYTIDTPKTGNNDVNNDNNDSGIASILDLIIASI